MRLNVVIVQKKRENDELSKYEDEAKEDIQRIEQDFQANKRQVMRLIMEQVLNVNLEVPKVVKKQFE